MKEGLCGLIIGGIIAMIVNGVLIILSIRDFDDEDK